MAPKDSFTLSALGMVNALGASVGEIEPRLFSGDTSRLSRGVGMLAEGETLVGKVVEHLADVPSSLSHLASRNTQLLLQAYQQIAEAVERCVSDYGASRIGVVVGSSTSGIANGEVTVRCALTNAPRPSWYRYSQQEIGAVSSSVALMSGARGPAYTISTACSSSAKVFASARSLLRNEVCDAVICGGADSLCGLTVNGFKALGLLAEERCNPFSRNRAGITIGEGAALFLLERGAHGVKLLGVGESSDAYHISAPDPSGVGAKTAILSALNDAQIEAPDVSYVNLHGTGTVQNDAMEAVALAETVGPATPCSSTKPLVGHTLGASGAIEIGFLWLTLRDSIGRIPPHCYDGQNDPTLPGLSFAAPGDRLSSGRSRVGLSTSFGFGGSNCAVVLGYDG